MAPRTLAFGPFELERIGEVRVLRKSGVRLKIQGQPPNVSSNNPDKWSAATTCSNSFGVGMSTSISNAG